MPRADGFTGARKGRLADDVPVKLGVGGAILLAIVGLIIAATVFRNRRAAETLQFGKKVAFAYIAAIVLLALWQLWSEGF